MVNFERLGYRSIAEYHIDFIDTLLTTNRTYDFFVDWGKIFKKLEENFLEISILNSLSKLSAANVEIKFREVLERYPECVPIIPLILAVRDKKIDVFDVEEKTTKTISFLKDSFDIEEIIKFSKKTGLLNLFCEIDDLYSYLTGTEVGLDTNARKNRSGHIFENVVGERLKEIIESNQNTRFVLRTH